MAKQAKSSKRTQINKPKRVRYRAGVFEKNKMHKKQKHKKKLLKQAEIKDERLTLLREAMNITNMNVGKLYKKIGTLNSRRLQSVIDGTYLSTDWYKERKARRDERKSQEIRTSRRRSRRARKTDRISKCRNRRDKKIQVDKVRRES